MAGSAAFLGVAYSLFAYVRAAHGKERGDLRAVPLPQPFISRVAVSLVLVADLGRLAYACRQFEVLCSLNSQSLYAGTQGEGQG